MFGQNEKAVELDDAQVAKTKALDEKIAQNVVVHKMPKNYKAGTFSYEDYFNHTPSSDMAKSRENKGASEAHSKNKKIGFVIVLIGVIVVALLAYGAFAYIKNPEKFNFFSSNNAKPNSNESIVPITPVVPSVPVVPVSSTTAPEVIPTDEPATSTEPAVTPVVPEIPKPQPAPDTDSDGLNDKEEALLGTDANAPDSDNDQFNDLTELVSGYNPAGTGKLVNNANIKKYLNVGYKYSILYIKSWKVDLVDKGASVIFTADDQSFIQVVSQANEKKQTINDWYQTEFGAAPLPSQAVKYNNWEGIKSTDGLIVYLSDTALKNIYIISYTPISDQNLDYANIFEAMVRSFFVEK
jgi:hypothetical protein